MSKIEILEPTDAERGEKPALKGRRGWPKGKPRGKLVRDIKLAADRAEPKAMLSKMKARPNWAS